MSRWDIFRWRTLAGGPPCRQGRQRFSHQAFLSPRPKRVPPFGISDGGGDMDKGERLQKPISRLSPPRPEMKTWHCWRKNQCLCGFANSATWHSSTGNGTVQTGEICFHLKFALII